MRDAQSWGQFCLPGDAPQVDIATTLANAERVANLPAHTSLAMRTWAATQQPWLQVEYLPASAPDLNPVEGWGPT